MTFYCVKKPEMAIKSFTRAWGKAPNTMIPNIAWRMAVCYLEMGQPNDAIDVCLKGLSADDHASVESIKKLNRVCFEALERKCVISTNPSKSASLFMSERNKVKALAAPDRNKRTLLEFIDLHIKAAELASFPDPGKGPDKSQLPAFPIFSTAFLCLLALVFLLVPHEFVFLLMLPAGARLAYYFYKVSEYNASVKAHEAKKAEYKAKRAELSSTRSQINKLEQQQR